jgi:hypothetical protein
MVRTWIPGLFLSLFAVSAQAADVELIYERGDKNIDLKVALQLQESPVYERGQAVILYQVETRYPALHLRYAELKVENAISHRIPLSSEPIAGNRYRHYFGWTLHPQKAGIYEIQIPDVAYYRGGNINYRIKGQKIRLEVAAVPDYIPRQLPVGHYSLQLTAPSFLLMQGSEVYFDLFIHTDGVADVITRPNPPEILKAYQAAQGIQLNSIDKILDRNGLHTRYHYRIPVKIGQTGLLGSQAQLQWFDPQQQKLQSQVYHAPRVVLLNGWQLFIIGVVVLLGFAYLAKYLSVTTLHYLHRLYGYYRLQSQLDNIESVAQLRQAIRQIARAEGMHQNMPVARLLATISASEAVEQPQLVIESVNQALYGNGNLSDAVTELANLGRSRMGIMRFIWRK